MGSHRPMHHVVGFGAVLTAAAVTACAHGFAKRQFATPADLFEASMLAFRRGDYSGAATGFQRATLEFPSRDPAVTQAHFYLGECHYAQGEYLEATREFRKVSDETPQHPLAPTALLRAGDAQAELWKRPELDPTYGENARATYQELLGRYPDAPDAARGRVRLAALNERFATKDYRTALFYLRIHSFDSAIIYLKSVVTDYGQSSVAPLALLKLIDAYRHLGYVEETREVCTHLRQYYPNAKGLNETCPPVPSAP